MRTNLLKYVISCFVLVFVTGISTSYSQYVYSYHQSPIIPWSIPATLDGSAGIANYPGNGINFMTQYAVRFSPEAGEVVTGVNFWLDSILDGVVDSTVTYARPEAAFQWPIPFTHVPQRFTAHAMRFTSPLDNTLQGISVYAGSLTASSDGFNDTLRVSILKPQTVQTSTIRYGNENATNNATWNFYFPVGTSRTAYATRFTMPDNSELAEVEFFVGGINNNTFLPSGDTTPNDSLVVSVWTATSSGLPDQKLGEVSTGINTLEAAAWNTVNLADLGIQNETSRDLIIAFQLKIVGAMDHIGISAGSQYQTPLNRSLVLENGNWVTIAASAAYSGGNARGAELWTRAKYTPIGSGGLPLPDENTPLTAPVLVPMSEVASGNWIEVDFSSAELSLRQGQDFWVSVDLITVGQPDTFSFISGNAEPSNTNRAAARIDNGNGTGSWSYMSATQFGRDYHFRIRAEFQVPGESDIEDDVLILFYDDLDGLPNNFLGLRSVKLSSLEVGAMNQIQLYDVPIVTDGSDIHVAISAIIESNQFALGSDDGSSVRSENRSSAYFLADQMWKKLAEVPGSPGEVNMAIELLTMPSMSIEDAQALPIETKLLANYPNPFNPTTQIPFNLAETGSVSIEVFDITGKRVAVLLDGQLQQGRHSVNFNAESLASGVYLVRLTAVGTIQTRKLMLIK
jgi:hypothetical protein